jgi:hypothetical protein
LLFKSSRVQCVQMSYADVHWTKETF